LLRERDNGEIKVNLRSKTYVDVAGVASRFSGGGHAKAAGFTARGTLGEVICRLLEDIIPVIDDENCKNSIY